MQIANHNDRYSMLSICLHWLMLVLLIAVYICIESREFYIKGSDTREALKAWHFMLGLCVFLLVWIRLIVRMLQKTPLIDPAPNKMLSGLAKTMHVVLYLFMILMPIGGWLILSGEGKDILFFGLSLPPLINENKEVAEVVENIHETVGEIGYYLIALHALAAIIHHHVFKDNTLKRMAPWLYR